jgi:hypothetical protein
MTLQLQEQEFDLSEQLHHNAEPLRIQRLSANGLACPTIPIRCVALIAFLAMTPGMFRSRLLSTVAPVGNVHLFRKLPQAADVAEAANLQRMGEMFLRLSRSASFAARQLALYVFEGEGVR